MRTLAFEIDKNFKRDDPEIGQPSTDHHRRHLGLGQERKTTTLLEKI